MPSTRRRPARVVPLVPGEAAATHSSRLDTRPPVVPTASRSPAATDPASAPAARATSTRSTGAPGALARVT